MLPMFPLHHEGLSTIALIDDGDTFTSPSIRLLQKFRSPRFAIFLRCRVPLMARNDGQTLAIPHVAKDKEQPLYTHPVVSSLIARPRRDVLVIAIFAAIGFAFAFTASWHSRAVKHMFHSRRRRPILPEALRLERQECGPVPSREAVDLDGSPARSLDLWERAWADARLLESAPLGPGIAPLVGAITARQNPPDCSRASFFVFDYYTDLGFGAQIRHLVSLYNIAVRTERVFVLAEERDFYWTKGCEDDELRGRYECFFRKLSHCSYHQVLDLARNGTLPHHHLSGKDRDAFNIPIIPKADPTNPDIISLKMNDLSGGGFGALVHDMWKPRGAEAVEQARILVPGLSQAVLDEYFTPPAQGRRAWFVATSWYFLRLNKASARRVRAGVASALGTDSPAHDRLAGTPVRASDKCYGQTMGGPGEMTCFSLRDTLRAVDRLAFGEPRLTHLVLTSEEEEAIAPEKVAEARTKALLRPLCVRRNDEDLPPGTGGHKRRVPESNAVLLEASLVTLHLQAQAGAHIITPRSTFHSLIGALAKAVPGKAHHVLVTLGADRDLAASRDSQFMS